ncbi:MAG: NTP transferase domain-containing protein [Bdellovibrionota bacterium]
MNVLLLAAGMGTRLKDMTTALPKSLLKIKDQPILRHILTAFENTPRIENVTVVTGFERELISDFLGSYQGRLKIDEVWNKDFRKGNFYSVEAGLSKMKAPFFITNADHVFPSDLLNKIFQNPTGVSGVCDFDRPLTPDCMKVLFEEREGRRRISKIHKKLETFNAGYIGMTVVAEDGIKNYLKTFEAIREKGEENAYAEQVLQELAMSAETAPNIIDASGFGWLEIDTAEDLDAARAAFETHPNFIRSGRN